MSFSQWAAKVWGMDPLKCPRCSLQFAAEKELAEHLQKHRYLPISMKLTGKDKSFLKSGGIMPWDDEELTERPSE